MRYEIYCDESHPDVFWSQSSSRARYLCIGGLWLAADLRTEVKGRLRELTLRHGKIGELKWHKVHAKWEHFYRDLIDLFVSYDAEQLRFRCILVEGDKVSMEHYHDGDPELGFYKFYYQMLVHWIESGHEYAIYCDNKTNRQHDRLQKMHRVLQHACSGQVVSIQALPSHEVQLLQLADFLLGMVSSRFNNDIEPGGTKDRVISYFEERLGKQWKLLPTSKGVRKLNIFKIALEEA
ncbi:MAG: DUF3800 domain-containing protein [bacterium]